MSHLPPENLSGAAPLAPEESADPPDRSPRRGGGNDSGRSRRHEAPPPKLYKIGEVMQYTGLSRQTIHNYTMLGLITEEARTPSGHRLYGEGVFERLRRIQELKAHASLREVRERLESGEV